MIYILWHTYEYIDSNGYEEMEQKFLGIYSTYELAEQARDRYYKLPGFCDYAKDCFFIEDTDVDIDFAWNEGFFKY